MRAPVFLSDKATLVLSATRDEHGERVVLVSWHQGEPSNDGVSYSGQIELTELDAERARDFLDAWLAMVPPPEPREAA